MNVEVNTSRSFFILHSLFIIHYSASHPHRLNKNLSLHLYFPDTIYKIISMKLVGFYVVTKATDNVI